jgi:hypothetical protein
LLFIGSGQQHRPGAVGEQFADDCSAVLRPFTGAVNGFRHPLTEMTVMIDRSAFDVGERKVTELFDRIVR